MEALSEAFTGATFGATATFLGCGGGNMIPLDKNIFIFEGIL
jgi:hypothetical protein